MRQNSSVPPAAERALNLTVAALAAPHGSAVQDQGRALAQFGIGYVLLPAPADPALARLLDGVPGLRPVSQTAAFQLWRVSDPAARVRVVGHDGTVVAVPSGRAVCTAFTAAMRRYGVPFEVLSDKGNKTARAYGVVYKVPGVVADQLKGRLDLSKYNGDTTNELPLTATYVIDRRGVIRFAFVDGDYRKRAEPSAVVTALKSLKK